MDDSLQEDDEGEEDHRHANSNDSEEESETEPSLSSSISDAPSSSIDIPPPPSDRTLETDSRPFDETASPRKFRIPLSPRVDTSLGSSTTPNKRQSIWSKSSPSASEKSCQQRTLHVPGQAIGSSRKIIDKAEAKLERIKQERLEMEEAQRGESFRGIYSPSKNSTKEKSLKQKLFGVIKRKKHVRTAGPRRSMPAAQHGKNSDVVWQHDNLGEIKYFSSESSHDSLTSSAEMEVPDQRSNPHVGPEKDVIRWPSTRKATYNNPYELTWRKSAKPSRSLLFGEHHRTRQIEMREPESIISLAEDSTSSDVQSFSVVGRTTTYDSAIQAARREANGCSEVDVEFAVVELGEDEKVTETHAILVNRDDIEKELVETANENKSSLTNVATKLNAMQELDHLVGSVSTSSSNNFHPRKIRNGTGRTRASLTKSFSGQLKKGQQHQKKHREQATSPPYRVPARAYLL